MNKNSLINVSSNSDLLNVRDEILGNLNQFTYLFDDSPSKIKNHDQFKGMRGCQSVFSILSKIYGAYKFSASECEWAENNEGRVWTHLLDYPILAKRDKKYNLLKRFINRQKKNLSRIKKNFLIKSPKKI